MRHLSIFGGRKRHSSRKSIFGGYRKPNFRKSIFGGHKKPNSHKSIFGGRKRPNSHKSIFRNHRRPNFPKSDTFSAKSTFGQDIGFTHMTSFRTPKVLAAISIVWLIFLLFIYISPRTPENANDPSPLSTFTALMLCGSPVWLSLSIMYLRYLRLQTAKNLYSNVEGTTLIPEMTADDAVLDKTRSKAGQVYLIQSDRGYYKIGMTKNIDDRMATFHVKLPFEPDLIHVIECEDRRAMEKSLHIKFAAKRINGEWFDLTGTDVAFIKSIKKA